MALKLEIQQWLSRKKQAALKRDNIQYRKAKEYYEENGDLTISSKYKEQHGEQLSVWLLRKRRLRREKRFELLTDERIRLLDEIGFQWEIQI